MLDLRTEAANQEFARAHIEKSVPISELRSRPRYRGLETWCAKQRPRIEPPHKTAIAQRLLSLARQGQTIVDPRSVKTLTALIAILHPQRLDGTPVRDRLAHLHAERVGDALEAVEANAAVIVGLPTLNLLLGYADPFG